MSSQDLANIVYKALRPETEVSRASGSGVQISVEENVLTLCFSSQKTAALRALVNSYLRWVMMINDVVTVLE